MKNDDSLRKLHMIVISGNDEITGMIEKSLGKLRNIQLEFDHGSVSEADADALRKRSPGVVLLDMGTNISGELELLARLVHSLPQRTMVIVTASGAELEDIRNLMRVGVADFIPQPISRSELLASIESAIQRTVTGDGDLRPVGKVYTVLGAGGGAGATTLAIQIAGELTFGDGKEMRQACLIDFDLQFGNAAFSLDLNHSRGLFEILQSPSELNPVFLRSIMAQHKSGLDVLAAAHTMLPLDTLTPETAENILAVARSEYDHIVVDMPRAWTNWSIGVVAASDLVFVVTTDSVASLERARRAIGTLADQGLGSIPLMVVANRMEGGWGTRSKLKQAEAILGRKIDFHVRDDVRTVRSAADRGVFIGEIKRRSPVEKDVRKVLSHAARKLRGDLSAIDPTGHAVAPS